MKGWKRELFMNVRATRWVRSFVSQFSKEGAMAVYSWNEKESSLGKLSGER